MFKYLPEDVDTFREALTVRQLMQGKWYLLKIPNRREPECYRVATKRSWSSNTVMWSDGDIWYEAEITTDTHQFYELDAVAFAYGK